MRSFPVLGTWLSVCFLSLLPDSLPQLFLRCFPFSVSSRPLLFRAFPLPFCFLSSASVPPPATQLSVSSFPFSSCFSLTVASSGDPSAFTSLVFPVLSSLISHAFLPGSGTQRPVCFLSPFLASLPQLFHECLPDLSFRHFPFRFCFLSSASAFLPATQPSVSSFPFFPFLPLSGFFGAASPLSLPCFPRSSQPGFPCFLSRFPYLAFCWFPFVLPCFAPAAVPQVIPF